MGPLLSQISSPFDVQKLETDQLPELAQEIRDHLVESVAKTGGHLGPNLGVVELSIAIHRVFNSPQDSVVFDTGHQSYVHKLLTGRQDFTNLRAKGGYAGYPIRAESSHDVVENSHASTSLSWAHGIARGRLLKGEHDRYTVAVIGDGALTGGMAWEALNNIAADDKSKLVIVVNDNERSYAPTIGGLAHHLTTLRTTREYEFVLELGKQALQRAGGPGRFAYDTLHGVKKGIKDIVAPQGMFEDLGLKYVGPVDGHNVHAMEQALERARTYGGPVIVHAITQKGQGYQPAVEHEEDQFHAVGVIDPDTGEARRSSSGVSWTSLFANEVVQLADDRSDIVGITAAMLIPVGLHKFAEKHPDRVFDVGIAEQHAATTAAGLAFAGMHPIVAVYSTFLNRAFDQVLMDVALHNAGVTFVLDRAGITGPDGPSHHGMWDMSILQVVPNIMIGAPRDATQLTRMLREAADVNDRPTVLRFAKGAVPDDIVAIDTRGSIDVLAQGESTDVLVVGVGSMVSTALNVAERLADQGIGATVVDPGWVTPVSTDLIECAAEYGLVVTIEDGVKVGGVGSVIGQALRDNGIDVPTREFGIPAQFIDHASRDQVLADIGLTAQDIARTTAETWSRQHVEPDEINDSASNRTTNKV